MDKRQDRSLLGSAAAEVLDRQRFASFAEYYNYYRLSGTLDWLTPAERYNGTRFTDRGFEIIPALAHLQGWLKEVIRCLLTLSHI